MNRDYRWMLDAPTCMICSDTGLHDKTGSWKFCLCTSGRHLLAADPAAADKANATLEKLKAKVAK